MRDRTTGAALGVLATAESVIDFIALESLTGGALAAAPEFRIGGTAAGAAVIDPANTFYIGGSLGGIRGN